MTRKPIQRINDRIVAARVYLRDVGWVQGTHGIPGSPTDVRGALYHCAPRDGVEMIAARMLAQDGADEAWNDLVCNNVFEALQAMDHTYRDEDITDVYGKNWYGILGTFRLITMTDEASRKGLSDHIGPEESACILAACERVGDHPAFDDGHMLVHWNANRGGIIDKRVWMLTDALVASQILWPDIPVHLARILAPVAEKLGIEQ